MLIEIWERLRGYDKWVETEARIESSDVTETAFRGRMGKVDYHYTSGDLLTWTDASGEKRSATFTVPEDSPLYQLVGGETLTIRYDPANPNSFYFRELLRTQIRTGVKRTLIGILVAGAIILRIVTLVDKSNQ